MFQEILELKERGESYIKKYEEPVTNIKEFGDYILSYCIEDCKLQLQRTLAISRVDKKRPDFKKVKEDLPDLFKVFTLGERRVFFFQKNFPSRGIL